MHPFIDPLLLNEFEDQIKNPAVGDHSWKFFFLALIELSSQNHPIFKIISKTRETRINLTTRHLSHLVFKAVQFIKIAENDLNYRYFKSSLEWKREIEKIFSNPKKLQVLKEILEKNSVSTTIYERYIGPYSIITKYFGSKSITVADFGCGGNYGLRGIDSGEKFKPFLDLSPEHQISRAVNQDINLSEGTALDKENPDDADTKAWRLACRFFPKELDSFNEVILFETKLQKSKKIKFIKGSILSLDKVINSKFDAIILSLVFYQLTRDEQVRMVDSLKKFLKPNGLLIIQDYGQIDQDNPKLLDFNVSWHKKDFGFKTFIMGEITGFEFKEILGWFDSRCSEVKPGNDFDIIFPDYSSKASSPALAASTS